MIRFALLLACLLLVAAAPPPPAVLQPYIHGGRFDPGDYGWMRGRFEDATPAEKAAFGSVGQWTKACYDAGTTAAEAELHRLGRPDAKLHEGTFADPLCAEVATYPAPLAARRFADFQQALAAAKPVADTYLAAVGVGEQVSRPPKGATLAEQLIARPVGEQMLRYGWEWQFDNAPPLPPDVRAIVVSRMAMATVERDHANTQWLKALVARQGWPTISRVGKDAATQAWLLVQHADADPAFQLRALRLMEPLLAKREVSRANYAYLYDRVMLKIAGRQRYATQAWCRHGQWVPQPLEDEAAVARRRAEAGLGPLSAYLEQLRQYAGPCPPDPPKPAAAEH
jgi:hypothetical protein